jgi:hypothetical protein
MTRAVVSPVQYQAEMSQGFRALPCVPGAAQGAGRCQPPCSPGVRSAVRDGGPDLLDVGVHGLWEPLAVLGQQVCRQKEASGWPYRELSSGQGASRPV